MNRMARRPAYSVKVQWQGSKWLGYQNQELNKQVTYYNRPFASFELLPWHSSWATSRVSHHNMFNAERRSTTGKMLDRNVIDQSLQLFWVWSFGLYWNWIWGTGDFAVHHAPPSLVVGTLSDSPIHSACTNVRHPAVETRALAP